MHDQANLHPRRRKDGSVTSTFDEGNKDKQYPKLMRSKYQDLIVLFTRPSEGTIVYAGGSYTLGEVSKTWDMDYFEDYEGIVKLKQ